MGASCRPTDGFMTNKRQLAAGVGEEWDEMPHGKLLVDEMPSEATGFLELDPGSSSLTPPPPRARQQPRILVILGALTGAILLAVTLGFGLGWSFRDTNGPLSGLFSGGTPRPGSTGLEDWRLDTTSQYVLDMNWELNAPPTTRYFDLAITKGRGWPDGMASEPGRECGMQLY